MAMSPAGGFTVMMADLCEQVGFDFADPGKEFYDELKKSSNAGVIKFSNPLDMGDIYDAQMYPKIFYSVMHNDNVDGAMLVTQWPDMPRGEDVFYRMFRTDLSKEVTGTLLSSGKPLAVCLFGLSSTISRIKQNLNFPIFDNVPEMMIALKKQSEYYAKKEQGTPPYKLPSGVNIEAAKTWITNHTGVQGEESLVLLESFGITVATSSVARTVDDACACAERIGYPVVMKVVSADAVHKSEAGGVVLGIENATAVREAFGQIKNNLYRYKNGAVFQGVRVMKQAGDGYDMFVGGYYDNSFGPIAFFGYGGIYVEVFNDTANVLCPATAVEIENKVRQLKSYRILTGIRGKPAGNIAGYIDIIERVSHLLHQFPQIKELDINPVRVLADGSGAVALDTRLQIELE
jgi:Acyl-CoA synthetase (NDP forming)